MKIKAIIAASLLGVSTVAMATSTNQHDSIVGPWMTGTLLAPSGHTIPKGHTNVETYMFVTDDDGAYNDRWKATNSPSATNISPTLIISHGLTNWMDIELVAPYDFKSKDGEQASNLGDTGLTLGLQALHDNPKTWEPDLRLSIEETFPTGDYENLNPVKKGIDGNGAGSYQTSLGANFQKLHKFHDGRYLRTRLSLIYTIPASTNVKNFNSYGGGFGTRGSVDPGDLFNADLGFEYTLTQHWVPALDIVFTTAQASFFRGAPGVTTSGLPASVGASSSDNLSVAPAIEYNFSSKVGLIVGGWFSVKGREADEFSSGVAALNVYF